MQRGLDAILERQARQLRSLGLALLALGALFAVASIYFVMLRDVEFLTRAYLFAGALVFGGSGIEALRRSRIVDRDLAEKRRGGGLPTAVARRRAE